MQSPYRWRTGCEKRRSGAWMQTVLGLHLPVSEERRPGGECDRGTGGHFSQKLVPWESTAIAVAALLVIMIDLRGRSKLPSRMELRRVRMASSNPVTFCFRSACSEPFARTSAVVPDSYVLALVRRRRQFFTIGRLPLTSVLKRLEICSGSRMDLSRTSLMSAALTD